MKIFFSVTLFFFISCRSSSNIGPSGPMGPIGPIGKQGEQGIQGLRGEKGERGQDGESISSDKLRKLNQIILKGSKILDEKIVDATSYSFGFAPKVTGFAYLTSDGNIYKLENKNPQTLGNNLEYFSKIISNHDLVSIEKSAFGEDIKQFFTAVNIIGEVFVSEDLKQWKKVSIIELNK